MQSSSAQPRLEIPGIAQIVEGNGGLPKVRITAPAAEGEMYLHGAHVTSWKPRGGKEVLFVSAESRWDGVHAIRGGVPVCFPWFAAKADDPKAPMHGFVRTKAWQLESIEQAGGAVTVSMFTGTDEQTKKWWRAEFRLAHRVTFGAELTMELVMTNTGKSALRFEEALHAYFSVGEIEQARVRGLDAVEYLDKTDAGRKKTQRGDIVITAETDRVYLGTTGTIEVEDAVLHRRVRVSKENSRTTVVWNPWVEKARSFPDFGDDEWKRMICIETSNVGEFAVELGPGEEHRMKAVVRVAEF